MTNEEVDGQGSKEFVADFVKNHAQNYQQIGVIVGEPTDNKKLEIGHKGSVVLNITTSGQSGHSARFSDLKSHAIQQMVQVIELMNQLCQKWESKYQDSQLGSPTVCLTDIKTPTTATNQVPNTCTTTWDIRTTPQLHDVAKDLVSSKLKNLAKIELAANPAPYSLSVPDGYLTNLFQQIVPGVKITASPAGNDSCFFTAQEIEAVVFGPGQKEVIHQENESVELSKLAEAIKIYQQIIEQF